MSEVRMCPAEIRTSTYDSMKSALLLIEVLSRNFVVTTAVCTMDVATDIAHCLSVEQVALAL